MRVHIEIMVPTAYTYAILWECNAQKIVLFFFHYKKIVNDLENCLK